MSEIVCAGYRWLAEQAGYPSGQLADMIAHRGSERAIREQCESYQFLVATRDSRILGVVGIEHAEVTKLFVDPSSLREGIGTALFRAAEEAIMKAGHGMLFLGAFGPSMPFYEAMGLSADHEKTIDCGPLRGRRNTVMKKSLGGYQANPAALSQHCVDERIR
ncbi:MAG: GNAT family N-acetyltransferase [Verrucomicrobia bacterium]|nr:GNAT family N-acetyltransferase [Verrucomicrobiota bacterium]